MKNINDTLVKIASTLDSKGLHKSSEVVKNAEKALSNYKMAQYVGVQGYWLKNRRCWDNCYRQKRTSKPGSSAQEVWMECWDEYREAINNPKSTWAKYASGRDTIKVSEREEQSWNKVFAGKVENKMKKGLSRPEAIYTVIEAESQAYTTKMITASSNLMILADTLVSEGYEEVGKQAAKMSIELLKESEIKGNPGFWGRQMDKFNTWRTGKGGHSDVVKKIQDLINRANQLANMFFAKKPQQQVKTQSSTPSGFIIEAGKGTRIVEAQITPGADPKTYQPKTKPVPGEQQVFDFAKPKPGDKDGDDKPDAEDNDDSPADGKADTPQPEDNATNTTGGDGVADGEQDLNKNNQPDGQEDKNKNNQPDGQEDVNKNNTPDGQEDQAADTPEAPEGDTNQDGKVDANDQQTGEQPESPRAAYEALVNDVMTMVGDFSGLQQTANDPKVAQLVTETTPLLQKFIGSKNTIAQMPKGPERVKFLRDTLGTLVQNLQGVLAKQGPAAQPGAETGGMPPAGAETGGMPPTGNQMPPGGNQLGGDASKLVQVATSGQYGDAKAVQGLVRSLNSGALKDGVLEWVTNFFEEQGVPFTFANYTQFKNDLGAAAVNPAISNQRV
jgi:hypothetical protein